MQTQKYITLASHLPPHQHTCANTRNSLQSRSDSMDTQSVCVSKQDWHPTVGGHWGQWSEESFFPAIIKQFNWICSYAGELLVWISIPMPSYKSYFQVHWALSSAKLILHDTPWGLALCFLYTEDTLIDTSKQVAVIHTQTQSWNTDN